MSTNAGGPPGPEARRTVSQKMRAVATQPSPARLRVGTIIGIAFAVAVLLLIFMPHPPGEEHGTMEVVAVMSLGVAMLALLAPETLSGIQGIIKAAGGAVASLRGKRPE